jgi:hypothetical protein
MVTGLPASICCQCRASPVSRCPDFERGRFIVGSTDRLELSEPMSPTLRQTPFVLCARFASP